MMETTKKIQRQRVASDGLCVIFKKLDQIDYNIIQAIKKFDMQDHSSQNPLFSYFVMPSTIQYVTIVPLSPSSPAFISPTSEITFASMCLQSPQINQLYCRPECSSVPLVQTPTIVELSQLNYPSQTSINIQIPQNQHTFTENRGPLTNTCNAAANLVLEGSHSSQMQIQQVNKKQKIKQNGSRAKEFGKEDKQYLPRVERRKKDSMKYQENQNRNIIPNEINQIFSFIQKYTKSGYLIQKLFQRFPHPHTFSVKRFYLYQGLLKGKLGHYTNEKSLKLVTELYEPKCESWPEAEQRFYNKLCRILIRHFLYEDSIFIILTSKRMKSTKKASHLRARRSVAQTVLQILKGF